MSLYYYSRPNPGMSFKAGVASLDLITAASAQGMAVSMLCNLGRMNQQGKRNNKIKHNSAEDLGLILKSNKTIINIGTIAINSKQNNNQFTSHLTNKQTKTTETPFWSPC